VEVPISSIMAYHTRRR